jgi:hypothetical protein
VESTGLVILNGLTPARGCASKVYFGIAASGGKDGGTRVKGTERVRRQAWIVEAMITGFLCKSVGFLDFVVIKW